MLIKKKQTTSEQIENLTTQINEKEMRVVYGGDEGEGSGEGGGSNVTVGDDGPG